MNVYIMTVVSGCEGGRKKLASVQLLAGVWGGGLPLRSCTTDSEKCVCQPPDAIFPLKRIHFRLNSVYLQVY